MRVTQTMLSQNMLRYISNSYERLAKYQEQLVSGKKITRPSDDPVIAMKGMAYRTNLTEVEQYKRNLSELYNWMDNSDAGLEQANAILQRVRELVVQASNDTNGDVDREAMGKEIAQLTEALANVANTQVAGKYIFNGTDVTTPPVTIQGNGTIEVFNNSDAFMIEVSKGITVRANIDPEHVFNQDLFDMLKELQDELLTNGSDIGSFLGNLDTHITNLISERAELGARYNRVELIENRLGKQEVIANQILADNEGADMERVITDLITQESVHRASLAVGARIIQPTLIDFLR